MATVLEVLVRYVTPTLRALATLALFPVLQACGSSAPGMPMAPTPVPTPVPVAPASMPSPDAGSAPEVVRRATIRGANGHAGAGTAQIVRRGDRFALDLGNDFRIDAGNIDVYLARGAGSVDAAADLNLGALRQLTGAQSYEMPNAASGYPYLILWCRPFRVAIGLGELR